jgi:hypothetical protein
MSENVAHVVLETVVDWNGNLPEFEGVRVNVFECDLLLVLDGLLEGADGLCSRNFDREYVVGIIVVDEAVEFEDRN